MEIFSSDQYLIMTRSHVQSLLFSFYTHVDLSVSSNSFTCDVDDKIYYLKKRKRDPNIPYMLCSGQNHLMLSIFPELTNRNANANTEVSCGRAHIYYHP